MPSSLYYDVVTFGEGFLRLSPSGYERLEQAGMVDVHVAGEELEIAVCAGRLGLRTVWLSALSDNPLGRKIANKAREHGVDISHVRWSSDGRVGLVYVEPGSAPRETQYIDDRKHTAFQYLQPGQLDWSILAHTRLFHTGVRLPWPAWMNRTVLEEGLEEARRRGSRISIAVDGSASSTETDHSAHTFLEQADVLVMTERVARHFVTDDIDVDDLARRIRNRFHVGVTAIAAGRSSTPRTGEWQGAAADDDVYRDRLYTLEVIDPAGAFSAFTGGFLYGYLKDDPQTGLSYGNAAAALAHTIPGNLSWIGADDISSQIKGEGAALKR